MEFKDFEQYFSHARINRYLIATGNNTERTIELYKANVRLAQALHPLLGMFEVVLRNRINDRLSTFFRDPDWIINQKTGFMVDPSLVILRKGKRQPNRYLRECVDKAEKIILTRGAKVTSGKVIAEQTLGFWTDLYATHHYKLLRGQPIQIFKSTLPPGYGRKELHDDLNKARLIRNRINPCEPICFAKDIIDLTEVKEVYRSIISILNWIDPNLGSFINDLDGISNALSEIQSL